MCVLPCAVWLNATTHSPCPVTLCFALSQVDPEELARRTKESAASSEAAFKKWKAEKDRARKEAKVSLWMPVTAACLGVSRLALRTGAT